MHPTESAPSWLARRTRLLVLGVAAWRGGAAAEPPADAGVMEFDIPAGPLGQTLLAIARRTGTLVSFKPGVISPHQAPAIQGRFKPKQALDLALGATGLSYQMTPSGVVTVVIRE
jgi:hypothetical protein